MNGAMSKADKASMAEYQAEADLRTLIEAEKIKKDKARYGAAMKRHKEMTQALANIEKGD